LVSGSNAIDISDLQQEKQQLVMTSTLAGMKILFNPLDENADDSICRIFESFSNETNFSDWHFSMNDLLMISIEDGIHR
jgi:hypothetical protein